MKKLSRQKLRSLASAVFCFLLGTLAFFAPVWPGVEVIQYVGGLLVWAGIVEIYHSFRRTERSARQTAQYSGAISLLMAVLLLNAALLKAAALFLFIAILFGLEAFRYLRIYFRPGRGNKRQLIYLLSGVGNSLLIGSLLIFQDRGIGWVLAMTVALRMVGIGLSILAAKTGVLSEVSEDLVREEKLASIPEVAGIAEKIEQQEEANAPFERKWVLTFIMLLFFIHLGRMGFDRSFLGILSPLIATIGDMVIAIIVTYALIGPLRFAFKEISGWVDNKLWMWVTSIPSSKRKLWTLRGLVEWWLTYRLQVAIQFRKASYSFPSAVRLGLRMGLPWAALLAAIMPVLGMSWYFDTENWASGIWDRWAASRCDEWRKAMTNVSGEGYGANAFRLQPQDVNDTSAFSFVVIGDPGEGDASQLVLKDQIIQVCEKPEVKFMVISSDVIYPSGALKDYEKKFWLPFKGVTKPVYAIPGNHDWYDALEGFVATFFEPKAAAAAIKARIKEDLTISTTSSSYIQQMLETSARLRKEYGIPTGFQKAPYFQVTAGDFVLVTLETGIVRQLDTLQLAWLHNVLEANKGKFVMVLAGHPFYAIGEYQGNMNPEFEKLHRLLREYRIPLMMAGDKHDFEYYRETDKGGSGHVMHHFVNGGGGAYLSIGTAMADTATMPTDDYAFYPTNKEIVTKIESNTSWYKYPTWWYTKKFNGWPFSTEWLSAAFDYNVAPFFQSFVEIKVDPLKKEVQVIPYGNNGRLHWNEITSTAGSRPPGARPDDEAAWVFSMK